MVGYFCVPLRPDQFLADVLQLRYGLQRKAAVLELFQQVGASWIDGDAVLCDQSIDGVSGSSDRSDMVTHDTEFLSGQVGHNNGQL